MKNINEMTSKELKEVAKELKVKNWWTLKKTELIAAIQDAQNEPEDAEEPANEESIVETEETTQNESETSDEVAEEKPNKKQDLIEYNGKTQNLSQWAKELNIPGQTLYARLRISNWSVEKAFTTPIKKRNKKTEEEA